MAEKTLKHGGTEVTEISRERNPRLGCFVPDNRRFNNMACHDIRFSRFLCVLCPSVFLSFHRLFFENFLRLWAVEIRRITEAEKSLTKLAKLTNFLFL